MDSRIVAFGATGYTGRLVVASLVARGHRPVLAGRGAARLEELAAEHGDLETAVADVADPASVRALVGPGDVLVSTVGPFTRYGQVAVEAAVDAGAHYVDSTGEAPFIRAVFTEYGPRASSALLTAFGYDYVPGNLAGALALREAGPDAARVDIGYFLTGLATMSSGTRASSLAAVLLPHHAYRGGRLVVEPAMRRVGRFECDGRVLVGGSVGATEQFTLPRYAPGLEEVGVYLGWLGGAVRAARAASYVAPLLGRLVGTRAAGLLTATGEGADADERARGGSRFLAVARDRSGRPLATARVEGVDAYTMTGELIAWAAGRLASGEVTGTGALGPVEAFGLDTLEVACREAGLTRIEVTGAP
ncbi:MAG TPA: saccharopine dehydrogenase NADP-binding domain-containing protein [Mycobacteriales bacterium]